MQLRFVVESELSYDKDACKQCTSSRKRAHCHCASAVVTDMLRLFDTAYQDDKVDEEIEESKVESTEKIAGVEKKKLGCICRMKEKLISRKTFLNKNHMGVVYNKKATKEDKKV